MKKTLFLFLCISTVSFGQRKLDKLLQKWNTKNVTYISSEGLAIEQTKAILLDAREEKEFKVSHLKNAIYVGYSDFKLKETLEKLPKDKDAKIVVYCSLGIRSEVIAYQLITAGYTNVYNLYGGIFKWKNNNFKVIDTLGNETEKIHVFSKDWSIWLTKGKKVYE
ncbi:MAG: rhodanese-related sulfurtransferase [Polaribacter sp.]